MGGYVSFIDQLAKRTGMNRQQIADEIDVSKSLIDKIASGKMKLRKVIKYALLWMEHSKK